MKRAIIYTLAFTPTVLLVVPALAALIDGAAWILLSDTLIQDDWADSGRMIIAWAFGALSIPVGALTWSVLSDMERKP